ncbi:UvrD-helicase domain-containing protein [Vibrio sp. 10N.247.311.12]|uniref:UvrD-helicase domain-containing protein n=1 Tax=Vibrio sp. 10N.247.311.12 TaxID=3229991 RepID=UPI00354E5B7F
MLTFTDEQNAAIVFDGSMVLTACPGSGKTTVMVEKIRKELNQLADYKGIIGITFTVKASSELKKKCKSDGFNTKSSFFGTIDSFCLIEIVYPFLYSIHNNIPKNLDTMSYFDLSDDDKLGLPDLSIAGNLITIDNFKGYSEAIYNLISKGILLLEANGIIALKVLESSKSCRRYIKSRYTAVYVDEYQDSSESQHALFLYLHSLDLKCISVGDIQQSIYAFRGSNPKYLNDLINNEEFKALSITINHRCHPSIINYASRLYNEKCHLLDTDDNRVIYWNLDGTPAQCAITVNNSIEKLIENNKSLVLKDIAVLVRNNSSLDVIKNNFNLPLRIYEDVTLEKINSTPAIIANSLLRFYFDHSSLITDVMNTILKNINENDINFPLISNKIRDCRKEVPNNIIQYINSLFHLLRIQPLSNIEEREVSKILTDDYLMKQYKPIDDNEVQVMTLHKAKGLEFKVVYHLDLYDWVMPKRVFIKGNYDVIYENYEQCLNLHYVGITRAIEWCVLVTSNLRFGYQGKVVNGQPSQFISLPTLANLRR